MTTRHLAFTATATTPVELDNQAGTFAPLVLAEMPTRLFGAVAATEVSR